MQKLFYTLLLINIKGFCLPLAPDYASLAKAKQKAGILLSSCLVPNLEPNMQTFCKTEYALYIKSLTLLALPMPLQMNTDGYISPFAWSPYDICRFEVGRMVNDPICG